MGFDYGDKLPDGQHERHPVLPDTQDVQVPRSRMTYVHTCGAATRIGESIAKTYAVNPKYYSRTFCVGCKDYFPVEEFKWDDGVIVGQ